jgi:hypothetical protein
MDEQQKCKHRPCTCDAAPLQDYCCDDCRIATEREETKEEQMTRCHCGHADCGGEAELQAESLFAASEVLAAA